MKIIAYRKQFLADHSSTNYLFYSSKELTQKSIDEVSKLSSHVDVDEHKAEITYNGEWADLDNKRKLKFLKHFSVCVRESYDWWDMDIVLDKEKVAELELPEKYAECDGESSLEFTAQKDSLILWFKGFHLDYSSLKGMEELAELGIKIQKEIYKGKLDAIDVMANYCIGEPKLKAKLSPAAKELYSILESI
ncbi:MAG: hypothetical protein HUU50_03925 [Candidatus Brocadiae bacterium]|nr:hypothetical protein [Candidatus Brocadiia bacterium]